MRDYQFSIGKMGDSLKAPLVYLIYILVVGLLFWLFPDLPFYVYLSLLITGFIVFLIVFISKYIRRKTIDTLQITSEGIRTVKHGLLRWDDISVCSNETISGTNSVYIIMKDKRRYFIGFVGLKNYSAKANDELHSFYDEIMDAYYNIPEESRFKLDKNRIALLFNIVFAAFFLFGFLGMFLYWFFSQ